jgi:hypothetical protein
MRLRFIPGILFLLLTGAAASAAAESPELKPLEFLVGEWASSGSGRPGAGEGTAVFSLDLQGRVLERTSFAEYPALDGKPASRHDDLMIVYVDAGAVRADYYDSEGHVIRYRVESPAPGRAVFLSDAVDGQPRFRLSYALVPDGGLDGTFEIAPPSAPDDFKPYLSWHSSRAAPASK